MKKIVALFMVCAMAFSLCASAKSKTSYIFSPVQFQPHNASQAYDGELAITIPLIYKGTLKWTGWTIKYFKGGRKACVDDLKLTPDLYMTICQPCIACWPCTSVPKSADQATIAYDDTAKGDPTAKPITRWNLYIVFSGKKVTFIKKIDLIPLGDEIIFFAGSKNGIATVQYYAADGKALYTPSVQFMLAGKKDYYSFKALTGYFDGSAWGPVLYWDKKNDEKAQEEAISTKTTSYKLTTVGSFTGALNVGTVGNLAAFTAIDLTEGAAGVPNAYHMNGAVSLKRDKSLTKAAWNQVFSVEISSSSGKYIDDEQCVTPGGSCEEYFLGDDSDEFDAYLEDKYSKTLDQITTAPYDEEQETLTLQNVFFDSYIDLYFSQSMINEQAWTDLGGE